MRRTHSKDSLMYEWIPTKVQFFSICIQEEERGIKEKKRSTRLWIMKFYRIFRLTIEYIFFCLFQSSIRKTIFRSLQILVWFLVLNGGPFPLIYKLKNKYSKWMASLLVSLLQLETSTGFQSNYLFISIIWTGHQVCPSFLPTELRIGKICLIN